MVLSGANTCSGGVVVTNGTLVASNPEALPNGSSLTVGYGAASLFGSAEQTQVLSPTLPITTGGDTGRTALVESARTDGRFVSERGYPLRSRQSFVRLPTFLGAPPGYKTGSD